MENILGTGFLLRESTNTLFTASADIVFWGNGNEDAERRYYINNGKYRGNYLVCTFKVAQPKQYKLEVVTGANLPVEEIILNLS
jgi:hypothetical protein